MDSKRLLWTSLLVLAAGIFLISYKQPSLEFCVLCLGGLFIAAAVLNVAMQFARAGRTDSKGRKQKASVIGMFTAIAAGALGLWMVLAPSGFTTAMVYILGAMMILGGSFQLLTLGIGFKPIKFPFAFYILPLLVTICGIVICCIPPEQTMDAIVTIIAIAMIVFAVGGLIEVAGVASFRRSLKQAAAEAQKASDTAEQQIEDVTTTEP